MNPNFNKFSRKISSKNIYRQAQAIDWKQTKLKALVSINKLTFNEEKDSRYCDAEDIEYMINVFRYNSKNFNSFNMLKPIFNKSLATLEKIMDEMSLGFLYDRISSKIFDISIENTLKILIRSKQMLL